MEREIKNLIIRAKQGDKEAFGRVYEELLAPIYRYIYFRVKDKDMADDITQEVFFKIYRSLDGFKVTDDSPLKFFYTVARNLLIDNYRKEIIQPIDPALVDEIYVNEAENNPEENFEQKDRAEALKDALSKITESESDILTLKFLQDFSNAEISQITGKSEEAVRQLQSRGLKSLREILKKNDFI